MGAEACCQGVPTTTGLEDQGVVAGEGGPRWRCAGGWEEGPGRPRPPGPAPSRLHLHPTTNSCRTSAWKLVLKEPAPSLHLMVLGSTYLLPLLHREKPPLVPTHISRVELAGTQCSLSPGAAQGAGRGWGEAAVLFAICLTLSSLTHRSHSPDSKASALFAPEWALGSLAIVRPWARYSISGQV